MTDERSHESTLFLNDECLARLKRVKAKFAKIDGAAIIALALKGLKEKTDLLFEDGLKRES